MRRLCLLALVFLTASMAAASAASISVHFLGNGSGNGSPQQNILTVGQTETIILDVNGATVASAPPLPAVSGLRQDGSGLNPYAKPMTLNYFVTPTKAGDMVIPAFDIHSSAGILHVPPIPVHVLAR